MQPAAPYPDEYLATVEQDRQERGSGFEPALAARVFDLGSYDTIYLDETGLNKASGAS